VSEGVEGVARERSIAISMKRSQARDDQRALALVDIEEFITGLAGAFHRRNRLQVRGVKLANGVSNDAVIEHPDVERRHAQLSALGRHGERHAQDLHERCGNSLLGPVDAKSVVPVSQ